MKRTLDPNSNRKSICKVLSRSGARLSYIRGGLGGTSLQVLGEDFCCWEGGFPYLMTQGVPSSINYIPYITTTTSSTPTFILMHTLIYMFIHIHSHVHTLACYTHIHSNTHTYHHNPHMFINIHSTHMLKHIPTCS